MEAKPRIDHPPATEQPAFTTLAEGLRAINKTLSHLAHANANDSDGDLSEGTSEETCQMLEDEFFTSRRGR